MIVAPWIVGIKYLYVIISGKQNHSSDCMVMFVFNFGSGTLSIFIAFKKKPIIYIFLQCIYI